MGMDVDFVIAKDSIKELEKLLLTIDHGERQEICDDIISFVDKIKEKYKNCSTTQ